MFYVYHGSAFIGHFPSLADAHKAKDGIADPGKVKIIFQK
jgi:hypothetical protein